MTRPGDGPPPERAAAERVPDVCYWTTRARDAPPPQSALRLPLIGRRIGGVG